MISRLCVLFIAIAMIGCDTPTNTGQEYEVVLAKMPKKVVQTEQKSDSLIIIQSLNTPLPFKSFNRKNFTLFHFGEKYNLFEQTFKQYANITSVVNPVWHSIVHLDFQQEKEDAVLLFLIDTTVFNDPYFASFIWVINRLAKKHNVVLVNFSPEKALIGFDTNIPIVQIYERTALSEIAAAQAIFGAIPTMNGSFKGHQIVKSAKESINPKIRLAHIEPTVVGVATNLLKGIDSLALLGIKEKAFPGCQVLVAKDGNIIYSKSFGSPSYQQKRSVANDDLYDLASLTKVAATTLAVMKLYEAGKLHLNAPVKSYIKGNSAVHNIKISALLTHTSGLQANPPIVGHIFYARDKGIKCDTLFCENPKSPYTIKVAENVYFSALEEQKIWERIFALKPSTKKRYVYSDVNFMILQKIVETITAQPLDAYLNEQFYQPMGLRYLTYHPLQQAKKYKIMPTISDTIWRHQVLQGYVHDEGAALLGGVSGNAGLFSNAEDLAILFQMLLNEGQYGGKQYLQAATIKLFTSKQVGIHRGLGFDKPNERNRYLPYAKSASNATYGHTGYTGTCVWADPDQNLLFILLTNRVHPDKRNQKIVKLNIRSAMHQIVYDAIKATEHQ